MIIGGMEKLSLIDYPGKISAIVFTQGCNFRCHFCYNPMLVWPVNRNGKLNIEKNHSLNNLFNQIDEDDFFRFLEKRVGKLDGVVITGGEPTLHKDLALFIERIKKMGYLVKLDTNGTHPEVVVELLEKKLIDYIAMDIKGPLEKYSHVTGAEVDLENIKKSIKIIMASKLPYEFRTTVVPGLIVKEDIAKMGNMIKGARAWFLQPFRSNTELVDKEFEGHKPFTPVEMEEMREVGSKFVKSCIVR